MKIQLLLLIGLTAGFTACPEQVDPGFTGNTPSLSGKIENWPAGKTGSIRIRINSPSATPTLGTSVAIATDGTFSKLVYPTPSATDLTTIVGCNSSGTVTEIGRAHV